MISRLMLIAALFCITFSSGCLGPKATDYYPQFPDQQEAIFRVWQYRLPGKYAWVAVHLLIEIRTEDDEPGTYEKWQVFNWSSFMGEENEFGHVDRTRGKPRDSYINMPYLIYEIRGDQAENAANWIRENAPKYKYRDRYVLWPGPNSNTFVAHMVRDCPYVSVDLPPTAIGKDYDGWVHANISTTDTGVQLDSQIIGVQAGLKEGVELHLLWMTWGIDLYPPALKLPHIGRVGWSEYELSKDSNDD